MSEIKQFTLATDKRGDLVYIIESEKYERYRKDFPKPLGTFKGKYLSIDDSRGFDIVYITNPRVVKGNIYVTTHHHTEKDRKGAVIPKKVEVV